MGDYGVFLKVSDEFDENYTDEERNKLIKFYMEKISFHEKSKPNKYKDSGFDLAVPWVKDCATEIDGIYLYKSGEKKLCNLRVQIAIYKINMMNQQPDGLYLPIT